MPSHREETVVIMYKQIGRLAAKPVVVLIRGETGTGKELGCALYVGSAAGGACF
jgi:DNA-binding NtrC family response regulator